MNGELNILKKYFQENHLHCSDIWLESCLDWFKSFNEDYDETFMYSKVLEQWLLTDLTDIGVACFPPNLKDQKRLILDGQFAVQVMYFKDIAVSGLKQLISIRDEYKLTRNMDEKRNNDVNRMLDLYVTDGVQYVKAFEYERVPCLDINMSPGIKLLFIGPLTIYNGEILLEANNVAVLGGEVESLLVCNAIENIYARNLNKPENPNPKPLGEELNKNEDETQESQDISSIPNRIQNAIESSRNINSTLSTTNNEHVVISNNQISNDASFQQLNSNTPRNNISTNNQRNNVINSNPIVIHDSSDEQNFNEAFDDEPDELRHNQDIPNNFVDDLDRFDIIEHLEQTNSAPFEIKESIRYPITIPSEPFIYLCQLINNIDETVLNKTFRIKGRFLNIAQKIGVTSKGYNVRIEITDGTGSLIVDVATNIINKMIGKSPEELMALKDQVKSKNACVLENLKQILLSLKEKLIHLDCLMDIQFKDNANQFPVLVNTEPLTEDILVKLKQRIGLLNTT